MSLSARIIIAIFAILFGTIMFFHGTTADPDKAWFSYVFGVFCLFIGAASILKGRAAQFCGSIVGTCVFLAGLFYLGHELLFGPATSGSRSLPSIVNASLFLAVFGVPSILYVAKSRFGFGKIVARSKLDELLAVEFDTEEVRVRVLEGLDSNWNQSFRWSEVRRVCFKDEGLMSSDTVFVSVQEQEKPILVPTEAKGGPAFFGALCERGLFPEHVWRKAIGDTSGGTHCWPPHEK